MRRLGSHQSILLSVAGECSVFDGDNRIQDKTELNFDASDFIFSFQEVVQIALVSKVTTAKKIRFHIKNNREH